jgi:hypothetical protein
MLAWAAVYRQTDDPRKPTSYPVKDDPDAAGWKLRAVEPGSFA